MKKALFVSMVLLIIMAVSCTSTGSASSGGASGGTQAPTGNGRRVDSRVPQFVKDAVRNIPEDALVGIGTARMATLNQSRTIAETRARASLSRTMNTIVRTMVLDFTATSEVDSSAVVAYQENIAVALSQARLQGASIVDEDIDESGNYWVVVMLSKDSAAQVIDAAAATARLRTSQGEAFNARDRMDQTIDKILGTEEIGYSDRD